MIDNKAKAVPEKSALETIREAERLSHIAQYESAELFREGSWLQKPIKTITDLYPYFDNYTEINILDLGCGVGRSCIPFVCHFRDKCRAEAVDILDVAIDKLKENCRKYGLEKNINGVLMPLEDYLIQEIRESNSAVEIMYYFLTVMTTGMIKRWLKSLLTKWNNIQ